MNLNTNTRHVGTGIGTFRALASFSTGTGTAFGYADDTCDSCVSGTQIRISAQDVLEGLTEEARVAALALSSREHRHTVVAGKKRLIDEYPRCDCHGDQKLARLWKKQAGEDLGKFIESMFNARPENMTSYQRSEMRKQCAPYLSPDKLKMLNDSATTVPRYFWDMFSGKLQHVQIQKSGLYSDKDALAILKSAFPKFKSAKKLSDIKLEPATRFKIRNTPELTRHFSDNVLETIGLVGTVRKSTSELAKLSPELTLAQTEAMLLREFGKRLHRDQESGRLVASKREARSKAWAYIRDKFLDRLPKSFLDKYSTELFDKKRGRPSIKKAPVDSNAAKSKKTEKSATIKPTPRTVVEEKSRGEKQKDRLKRRKAKQRRELREQARMHPSSVKPMKSVQEHVKKMQDIEEIEDPFQDEDLKQQAEKQVSTELIKDPDRLRRRINNMSQKIDDKFLFGTPFEKYTDLQWALMDSIRDSIAPELFNRFRAQVDGVRAKRNRATGGAYSSIVGNPQLALAHITTAWYCGELG